jgi:MFS family permease
VPARLIHAGGSVVTASALSAFGSAMALFAFAWLSYEISGVLLVAIIIVSAGSIPAVLLMRMGFRLAERLDPTVVAASSIAIFAVGIVLLAWLLWLGYVSIWLLLFASLVTGAVTAFYTPAFNLVLRSTAEDGKLDELDASLAAWAAFATAAGLITGGLLFNWVGAPGIFIIFGVSYVPLMVVVLRLPRVGKAEQHNGDALLESVSEMKLRATVTLIAETPLLRHVFTLTIIFQLLAWPLTRSFHHVADVVLANPVAFAALLLSFQLGLMAVWPVMKRANSNLSYSAMALRAAAVLAAVLVLVAVSGLLPSGILQLVSIMIILIPFGLAVSLAAALLQACMQLGAPDVKEPTVLAMYAGLATLTGMIGGILLGHATAFISIWVVLAADAIVLAVLIAVAYRKKWFADLDSVAKSGGEHPHDTVLRHHQARNRHSHGLAVAHAGAVAAPLRAGSDRAEEQQAPGD